MIEPWWPLAGLAAIQLGDAALCLGPVAFVRACLRDVGFPRRLWWLLPVIKTAAAGGLVAGIWIPALAVLTSAALVGYFLIAVGMHVRARDFGRNLFVNATGMLLLCTATLIFVLLAEG
ncbi:MAG: hypothetical protein GEV11_11050 [Streptosporangiales bacterium]|nr:hypothetical protein [Streptosporangiales bacterium]